MCEAITWEAAAAGASTLDDPNAAVSIWAVPSSLAFPKGIRLDPSTECCGVRGKPCVVLIVVRFCGRHDAAIPRAAFEDIVIVATRVANQMSALCGRDRTIVAVDATVPFVGRRGRRANTALCPFRCRVPTPVFHVNSWLAGQVVPYPAATRAVGRNVLHAASDSVGLSVDTEQLWVGGDSLRICVGLMFATSSEHGLREIVGERRLIRAVTRRGCDLAEKAVVEDATTSSHWTPQRKKFVTTKPG
jgi:hypothetical protein